MSDTTTPDAGPQPSPETGEGAPGDGSALSLSQAVQILADRRAARASRDTATTPGPVHAAAHEDAQSHAAHDAPTFDDQGLGDPAAQSAVPEEAAASEPPPEPASDAATIEIDGVTLTADDVRRGYMRQADYSRKTQALSQASRSVEAERTVKLARLDQLIGALESEHTREPDWAQVARADPLGWVQKKTAWDNRRTALESAKRISDAVHADTLARDRKKMVAELAGQYNAAWADPQIMAAEFRELARYALAQGFSTDEVDTISHAREMILLDKARRWDALQNSKAVMGKRLTAMPRVQKPGARSTVGSHQRNLGTAWERFLKNPTVENGAAYQRVKREAASFRRGPE